MSIEDKKNFITKYENLIKPTSEDPEIFNDIEKGPIPEERLDETLENFETKVFTYKSPEAKPEDPRFLFAASQPANFSLLNPLMDSLEKDHRCGGFTVLTDNVAGKRIEESDLNLKQERNANDPMLSDIPGGPYKASLELDEPPNSAMSPLENAKTNWGTEKTVFFSEVLFTRCLKEAVENGKSGKRDSVDLILTTNEITKEMICSHLDVPRDQVEIVGSPHIDNINVAEIESKRVEGRKKLEIKEDEFVVFYAGFPSSDMKVYDGIVDINQKSFRNTLDGVIKAANDKKENKFAFVIRTHPRARKVEVLEIPKNLPSNLRIINGDDKADYDETLYASEITCCSPLSTEVVLGPYKGKQVAFFNFSGTDKEGHLNFREICANLYGEKGVDILENSGFAKKIDSADRMEQIISEYKEKTPIEKPENCIGKIKEILLNL